MGKGCSEAPSIRDRKKGDDGVTLSKGGTALNEGVLVGVVRDGGKGMIAGWNKKKLFYRPQARTGE
jgi:hypothetical protein